jgi:hypothetical protein
MPAQKMAVLQVCPDEKAVLTDRGGKPLRPQENGTKEFPPRQKKRGTEKCRLAPIDFS